LTTTVYTYMYIYIYIYIYIYGVLVSNFLVMKNYVQSMRTVLRGDLQMTLEMTNAACLAYQFVYGVCVRLPRVGFIPCKSSSSPRRNTCSQFCACAWLEQVCRDVVSGIYRPGMQYRLWRLTPCGLIERASSSSIACIYYCVQLLAWIANA